MHDDSDNIMLVCITTLRLSMQPCTSIIDYHVSETSLDCITYL